MTAEAALHATEHGDYFVVEPLRPVSSDALDHPPAGYNSTSEPLQNIDQIVEMLQNHGLVEVFYQALSQGQLSYD